MKKILIAEDESLVAMEIGNSIKNMGYKLIGIAASAEQVYALIEQEIPDAILMDINLKGAMDGIDTAAKIKEKLDTPIIFLTAFMDESTIDRAIKADPAAYLIKPFKREELMVSLKIALNNRRKKSSDNHDYLIFDDDFSFDLENRELYCNNELVRLTKKERELLELLLDSKNRIVRIDTLENIIWPYMEPNENRRRALVARLRTKLRHRFIETFISEGYLLRI